MEDQFNSNRSELWSLSVRDLFYKYVRFLPFFLLSVALALLIAYGYLRYATRIYSAVGTMQIKSDEPSSRSDKYEDIFSGSNRTQNIQNEIEVLKSRPLMARVVQKLNLEFSYSTKGKIKDFNIYKQAPFRVQAFSITDSTKYFTLKIKFTNNQQFRINNVAELFTFGQVISTANGVFSLIQQGNASAGVEYNVSWQPTQAIAGALAGEIKVQPKVPGTSILSISIQTTNPQMAADIVNKLMAEYDSLTIEQNNYSTDQTLNFIDGRLAILDRELDSVQKIKLDFQNKNDLFDVTAQSGIYFSNISETDKAMQELRINVDVANMLEEYLKNEKNQYSKVIVPSSLGLADLTLNGLVEGYNKAQLDRQLLLDGGVTEQNPMVIQAEGQIEKLRAGILENTKNIKSSYNATISTLQGSSAGSQSQIKALPAKVKELVELTRQVDTKLELDKILQGKREEAAISRAATISNSKIVEEAGVSTGPVKPNKRTIQILAILLGIGLPAIFIFLGEVVNDKISTRFDIEKITQAGILGEIGHSFSDNVLIVNRTSRSMVAEQFRIIRSNLQYILGKADKGVILVTSSFSGEGKSYVTTNMAAVLALTGKKTIILEFDIRKPKILSGLKINKRSGATNYLVGKATLEDLIVPAPDIENLFVLPCGPIPPNPSELLLDEKVSEMFVWLRQNFDFVLVDTAPVGMVSDAMTLGKYADCTLYIVRQGYTFKKQIALIDELYKEAKLPKISIIINDVKIKPGYGYYGYGRYGYGYGYGEKGSYYEEEVPPRTFLDKVLGKLDYKKWFGRKK